jgi:mono/diheme cytochrome c family protein
MQAKRLRCSSLPYGQSAIIDTVIPLNFFLKRTICAAILAAAATSCYASSKTKLAEQAGANLFRDKGCGYCHGAMTEGTHKGPSLQEIRKSWKAPQITDQILNGGRKMPPFSDSLSNDQVAQLVAWLRAKHRPLPTPQTKPAPQQPGAQAPQR